MNAARIGRLEHPAGSASLWARPVPYVLLVTLMALIVASLAALALWQERQRYRERASLSTQNLARLLDQEVSDSLDKIDISLQSVQRYHTELRARGRVDAAAMNAYLTYQASLHAGGIAFRIVDAQGTVRFGGDPQADMPVSLADRGFFQRARDRPDQDLFVSGPARARIARQWAIGLSRRLDAPDGSFAGVALAMVPTSRFEQVLSLVELGAHGAATIRTTELALVHRAPVLPDAVGSKEVSAQLRDSIAARPQAGSYMATTALDGIERSNSYRRLARYPFYVIVGIAVQDDAQAWTRNLLTLGGLAGLAVLVSILAATLVFRTTRALAADVAARRRIEASLSAREQELRDLYDHAPCGYHSLDADGKFLQINATELGWLGCTREELIGKKGPADFFNEEGKALLQVSFPKFKAQGHVEGLEFDMRDQDGGWRRVSISANAIYDAAGRYVSSRSVVYDVTDVHRLEQQTQQLLREQRAILNNELIGIAKVRAREIVWANRGMETLLGYASGELLGHSTRILYASDAAYEAAGADAYPVLATGKRWRAQLPMMRKDGRELWIDLSGAMLSADTQESL